ncbi:hypothetical protein QBC37DRAFT_379641 [Rhypophila decipiens]|uniref:Uncharacterized protein n=1 Tax=Rhypophila decipiens TaxID=261697 RepID=A0AAN6XWE0_9PEZI|nr:hypothetical protein QBC37DRAFT_379641 [Rhypophila decipiens]
MRFAQYTLYATLIQLPIAVHQAKISLSSVTIDLEGIQCDEALNADPATLRSLSSAFKSLEEVYFFGCPAIKSANNLGLKALSTYLAQMVKSPQLQLMSIDTCGNSQGHFDDVLAAAGSYNDWARLPGSFLSLSSQINRNFLLDVTLSRVNFHCTDLIVFIASLPMSMEWLQLYQVHLLDGTWDGVLDELRMKEYRVDRHSHCGDLLLYDLTGGEFDFMDPYQPNASFRISGITLPMWRRTAYAGTA